MWLYRSEQGGSVVVAAVGEGARLQITLAFNLGPARWEAIGKF